MTDRAPPLDPKKVFRATLLSALVPGLGTTHFGPRQRPLLGLALLGLGLALAIVHLVLGLSPFDSRLGGLAFAHLLRSLGAGYAFLVLDTYLTGVDPRGHRAPPRRRLAVLLNLLLPGAGYLLARAWIRAATGLLLVVLVAYFAHHGHPYADIIFVAMQLVMGVAVYRQVRLGEGEGAGAPDMPEAAAEPRLHEPLPQVQEAQVVVLVVLLASLSWIVWVTQERFPPRLSAGGLSARQEAAGLRLTAGELGVSLLVPGEGWQARARQAGGIFGADHPDGAHILLAVQPKPAFMGQERFYRRLRRRLEDQGLTHVKSKDLTLSGVESRQMRFSGRAPDGGGVDQWAIAVPRRGYALVLLLSCMERACPSVADALERTRDSLVLK